MRSLEIDAATLAFEDRGEGPPLVLVHGYFLSSRTWRKVLPRLARERRCIAVDLVGAGSSSTERGGDLSIPAQAKRLVGLLDALELDHASFIGHDSGALLCRYVAWKFPKRVRGLVLSDTEIPGPRHRAFSVANRIARLPVAQTLFSRLLGTQLLWNRLLQGAIHSHETFDGDEFLRTHRAPLQVPALRRSMLSLGLQSDSGWVNRIAHPELVAPKLVLWGEFDRFVSVDRARAFYSSLPEPKRFDVIADCGTLPHEEQPEAWLESVSAFLDTPPAAGSTAGC